MSLSSYNWYCVYLSDDHSWSASEISIPEIVIILGLISNLSYEFGMLAMSHYHVL